MKDVCQGHAVRENIAHIGRIFLKHGWDARIMRGGLDPKVI